MRSARRALGDRGRPWRSQRDDRFLPSLRSQDHDPGHAGSQAPRIVPNCFQAAADGKIKVQIAHVLPLSQAAEAHRMMEADPGMGKIVLDPTLGLTRQKCNPQRERVRPEAAGEFSLSL